MAADAIQEAGILGGMERALHKQDCAALELEAHLKRLHKAGFFQMERRVRLQLDRLREAREELAGVYTQLERLGR